MSHPNPAGNGCSLEDCYTNLFALTDICGIKWRRLATNPDSHVPLGLDHLEDPVLVSYSKCIQSDILCVWRRIQNNAGEQRTDHLSFNKELWIFWYGDEPSVLESHVSKDLIVKETGSWDKGKDHGLSYECRTLLFKALHNLIERCLLTKGFARLGRWFVQPYDSQTQNTDRQTHLSFSFNFFLHGESSVCASIEVKQHPPVWRLTQHHLNLAQENHTNFQVILAPYGLNGTLTGQSYRDADQHAHKVLDEWSRFYPIDKSDKEGDPSKAPALVEVLVAGVRMKYPSSFVLLSDVEEYLHKNITAPAPATNLPRPQPVVPHSHLTPPSSPADISILADHGAKAGGGVMASGGTHHLDISSELIAKSERVFSAKIQEKMLQDNCINSVVSKRPSEAVNDETAAGVWDFNDPTTKLNCNCSRHRLLKNKPILTGQNKAQQGATNKHGKGDFKADKNDRPPSRLGRSTAFHRQSTTTEVVDVDLLMQRATVQAVNFAPPQGPGGTLPQLNNTGEGSTVPEGHSPAAVPSPLEEPNSHSHVSQSGEPTMPKLSPHPPPEVPETKPVVETNPSAMVNGHVDFAKPNDVSTPKAAENVMSPPWVPSEAKNVSINNWIKSHQHHKHVEVPGIKRPLLPTLQTDGESFVTENLYNLDPLNTWLSIPVLKKPRYEELSPDGESMISQKHMNCNSPQSMEDDPYEFSDEASINPATITNRKMRDSRDEGFHNRKSPYGRGDDESGRLDSNRDGTDAGGSLTSPPATPNPALKQDGLMHLNDLVVKPSDLDHIFESDSDNDDSSLLPKDTNLPDDLKHATKIIIQPTEGVIAASELIRMYPTPPSNNSEISPISYHEAIETYERPIIKKEINVPSIEEFLKDVPSVFQPQEQEEFVSSEKYSTVTLPSNKLSPIHHPPDYKASWQFPMPIMEKPPPNSYINIPSIENIPSLPSRMPSSAIESSPAMFQTSSVGPQRTPMSYELQSPASNASSYLNKTLNSVDNQGTNNQIAEVQSLIVNILLMDSRLNVFKDANFDSCNFCVCNGNIKGADSGILIEDPSGEAQYSCTCGFSAIRNRRFGIHAGLFYEDEVDITGVRNDRLDRRKPGLLSLEFNGEHKGDDPNKSVLELLLGQFTVPYPSSSSSQLLIRLSMNTDTSYAAISVDDFPLRDGNDVSYTALDQGRQAMEHCLPTKLNDDVMKTTCLHKWQFLQGATKIPLNSQDSQHLLKSLQPILQDAIQNKRVTRLWEQTFKLTGPLTWKEFHQLAGRGLCKQCSIKMKNFVKSDKTQVKLNIEEDVELFERLCGHISSIHEDKEDTDLDLDSQLSFLSTTTLTELSQQSTSDWEADNASGRDKFNRAMNILGNGKFPTLKHQLKLPWDDVSKSTKAMYLKFTSDVVNLIIQYIAPGQENKIMADLSEKYMHLNDDNQTTHDDMTKALIQAYLDQNNSQTQIQILSLFVQKFTKQKLIELIPGLTMSKIDRARKHANLEKPGQMINSPRIYRMRLSHPQLMHFIEFISSPSYHQAVGYGSKTLQLSSGVEMKIPKVVRSIISSRLIKTYMAYCKDQDYDTFSRSTLYNILNVCIASQKKNLHGLDNTTADGMKAMDTLTDIIKKLQLFGLEEEKVEKLKNIFASANQHLKFEIKGHLATSSTCLDHCTTFSLSDSKSTQFRSTCAHEHSEGCTKCSIIDKSLLELSNTFQTMNSIPAEIVDEIDHDLSRAQEQIMTWKAHCVRTVHQDQAKQTVLGNLKPHQALIVMDWAMKFLPVRHREAQSDFFGKKGVSWHVSSVVTLDIEAEPEFKTNFNVHTLVHILELGSQGWFSVAHIITDLLQKLPLILPLVTEIFLKSDNAGCYHCVPLISYIQNINVNGGLPVKILQYNFSEAQSGKDICDAKTSHCKMHILRYSGEGHDVLSAEDMSTALNSNGGVKGVFNAVVAIDQNHQTKTKTKIPNISAMNNFEFYSEGVKVRRAYGIGNGNFIPNLQFKDNKLMEGFQVIIQFSNFVADHHGRVVLARNNIDVEHENMGNDNDTENNGNENVTETVENEMEEDVSNDGLFACPDQSCTKVFTKPHFLEAHIVIGNHVYSTSENSYDSVKLIWAQQCEAVDREHKVLIQSVSSINMNVNEGWALKLNKPFKRFTKKVKDFLFDIYVKCESSGRRPNFDTLATELKTTRHENDGTKMFTREEWLSSSQIRSLFANFVRLGAETSLKSEDTAVIENVLEEIDSLEYHNNMTELATDVVQQFL